MQRVLIPGIGASAPYSVVWEAQSQRHEVGVDDEEVGEVFVDSAHDFVVVCFGEAFEGRFLDDVAEVCQALASSGARAVPVAQRTYVVFAVLGLPQLFDQVLYRVGRRPHEAEAAEMAHLLALLVVQAAGHLSARCSIVVGRGCVLGEVDLMVEEGGLRCRRGHDRHLWLVGIGSGRP